jgi:hypothetical protein
MFSTGRVIMTQIKVVPKSGSYFSNYDKIFGEKSKSAETSLRTNCRIVTHRGVENCQLLEIRKGEAFVKVEGGDSEIIVSAKCIEEYSPRG